MADLSTTYMGLKLRSPIIASSSTLTGSAENVKVLADNGVGAVVLKSLFEEEIVIELEKSMKKMLSENHLYPETMDFYDTYDVEDDLTLYLKLISDCKAETDIPIIASVNCVSANNWTYFAESLQDAGADAIELNVFAVPAPDQQSSETEKSYLEILEAVKREVTIPVSLKIGKYHANVSGLIKSLSGGGADAIVLFNRFFLPDIDIDSMELVSSNVYSNESEYLLPLRWIALTSGLVECDLSATTGIHDSKSLIKVLLAGAQTVQVATTLYKNGFGYLEVILTELKQWMDKNGFATIDEFRGKLSQSSISNPAGFLRFQFMKHISEK